MGTEIIFQETMSISSNFLQFLHMGGYAFYVWSAYGVAFAVLISNILLSQKHRRKTLKMLKKHARISHDTSSKKA